MCKDCIATKEKGGDKAYPHDPNFKGPIEDRGCTDVFCCVLFVIFFIAMIAIGIFAFTHGQPDRLLFPTNSDGEVCGIGKYERKPNLFFFDMTACARAGLSLGVTGCPTPQICVAKCPDKNFAYLEALLPGNSAAKADLICKPEIVEDPSKLTDDEVHQHVKDDICAPYYVKSSAIVERCVPSIFKDIKNFGEVLISSDNSTSTMLEDKFGNKINGTRLDEGKDALELLLNLKEYGGRILQDLVASWKLMIIFAVIAMVITFLWIVLLRWIAAPMIWITMLGFLILFGVLTYLSFSKYIDLKNKAGRDQPFVFTLNLNFYFNVTYTWLAFGIISAVILTIFLLLIICLCVQIRIATALIEQSSKAISNMISILFWPIVPFIFMVIILVFWGASAIFLASMGRPQMGLSKDINGSMAAPANMAPLVGESLEDFQSRVKEALELIPCEPDNSTAGMVCSFIKYGGDDYTFYLQIFQLFMIFWCMNLIEAISTCTVAGAFASYYWAGQKDRTKNMPTFPVASSLWRCFRYHLGSLAFGSLIVAIVQIVRTLLEYIDSKLKGTENKAAKYCLKCLKCCFWCLEKIIKYLNKNAYIMIAVHGKCFCKSATSAFWLIFRNIARAAVSSSITNFVILVGKLLIVGGISVLAAFLFSGELASIATGPLSNWVEEITPTLHYYPIVILIIAVATFIIASMFFSLFDMGVDTLFLCFLEDLDRNDGSEGKEYRGPTSLLKILSAKNVKYAKDKEGADGDEEVKL